METTTTEIGTPVLTEDLGAKLRERAQAEDRETDQPDTPSTTEPTRATAEPEQVAPESGTPDNSETDAENSKETLREKARERDEQGKFLPKGEKVLGKSEAPPESNYTKAQKEQERQKGVLANFEKEKTDTRAQFQAQEARLRQLEQQLIERENKLRNQEPLDPIVSDPKYNAQDLVDSGINLFVRDALEAIEEGNGDKAIKILSNVPKMAKAALQKQQFEFQQKDTEYRQNFGQQWTENMNHVMQAHNGEFRNPESPLRLEVEKLLGEQPIFEQIPGGFEKLVEVAKLRIEAAATSELREQKKQLEAELASLRQKTQLEVSGPVSPVRQSGLTEGSLAEQRAKIRSAAMEYDNAA